MARRGRRHMKTGRTEGGKEGRRETERKERKKETIRQFFVLAFDFAL